MSLEVFNMPGANLHPSLLHDEGQIPVKVLQVDDGVKVKEAVGAAQVLGHYVWVHLIVRVLLAEVEFSHMSDKVTDDLSLCWKQVWVILRVGDVPSDRRKNGGV